MYYSLVRNNKIEVGPRIWSWSVFFDYLSDESLPTTDLPKSAPDQPIVTDEWKILPTSAPTMPDWIDEPYEQLAGPFWTVHDDHVTGYYSTAPVDIEAVKGVLREKVSNNRYKVETSEFDYTIGSDTVTVDASRENRNNYFIKSLELNDGESILWKFRQGWFNTSKTDFYNINQILKIQIQSSFDWENQVHQQIGNSQTIEELKSIELRHSSQIPSNAS